MENVLFTALVLKEKNLQMPLLLLNYGCDRCVGGLKETILLFMELKLTVTPHFFHCPPSLDPSVCLHKQANRNM